MTDTIYDLVIIGGGINGCGIAREAACRGLKVLLVEQADLGSATSSKSTKLIHGGLRYLEHYEFRLVRHALEERERLWSIAPHIIWPLRFVLPHRKGLRPAWMLRLGLFLYDNIGGRKLLPPTRTLRLRKDPAGTPLRDVSSVGFEYSDCWVQDNRLVVLNARDAAALGAEVRVMTRCLGAERADDLWSVRLEDRESGETSEIRTGALVNAAGPWVNEIATGVTPPANVRLVQGSHIVVEQLYDHDRCYIFQNPDGRIFFAIPYEEDFTLIGTTDQDYRGDPAQVEASQQEIDYLLEAASSYFATRLEADDVIWSYSGVRALYDNGAENAQETTRDYVLSLDRPGHAAPVLSIYGGKITTYRCLAEEAMDKLAGVFPEWAGERGQTAARKLPGGDFPVDAAFKLMAALQRDYPFLSEREARRLVRHYGLEARNILGEARERGDLGRDFGGSLTEAEVRFLMEREYARTAEDVVWRRTKSGLRMTSEDIRKLDDWMISQRSGAEGLSFAAE
jgi:glycerol-3-phosphate dehydrogenase